MTARGSGTGTARVGAWRAGVDIEPDDEVEGSFAVNATADLVIGGFVPGEGIFTTEATSIGGFAGTNPGQFQAESLAVGSFDGTNVEREQFEAEGLAEGSFAGDFIPPDLEGAFAITATADLVFTWVPFVVGGGQANIKDDSSDVVIPDDPAEVGIKDDATKGTIKDVPSEAIINATEDC